jgi:hypothetical protein
MVIFPELSLRFVRECRDKVSFDLRPAWFGNKVGEKDVDDGGMEASC